MVLPQQITFLSPQSLKLREEYFRGNILSLQNLVEESRRWIERHLESQLDLGWLTTFAMILAFRFKQRGCSRLSLYKPSCVR